MKPIDLKHVSAILITKEAEYPQVVLNHIESFGFGEVIIKTNCDGIYKRFDEKPGFEHVYVQDDDCMTEINKIFNNYDGNLITCGNTHHHINYYKNNKICLIGHGAFFPWHCTGVIVRYIKKFGQDQDFLIETDRIFTFLNYPQKRVPVEVTHLPTATSADRLSMRQEHAANLLLVEEKLIRYQGYLL